MELISIYVRMSHKEAGLGGWRALRASDAISPEGLASLARWLQRDSWNVDSGSSTSDEVVSHL